MKRQQFIKHLREHGCFLLREGAKHSWWSNSERTSRSAVPRHREIWDILAKKICQDLGIPPVK